MDIQKLLSSMTQRVRDNLSTAVEIGKWSDGIELTKEQRVTCMQAVIAWDSAYGEVTDEPFKIQKGGTFNNKAVKPKAHSDVTIIKTIK